ncbi:hypothetical protein ACX9I7_25805 [Streptomyces sp. L500]|uniref:hypothetical protein n=1 Tax=Streptomyces abikoensis TaxID=97398 RepID=UPI001673B736|nr:hypothetical protein [Streptomyces abikoensis]GGP74029.1 hypothetical protein GCM10010214_56540 [Streptomyces abikoensis]
MQKTVVRQGDTVTLALTPPAAFFPPSPVVIPIPKGTAGFRVEGLPACVPDDIETMVIPVGYATLAFPQAGTGSVQLKVPAQNRATYARTGHGVTEAVVDGGPLELTLTVVGPASNSSGATDAVGNKYPGTATFTCLRVRPVTAG